MSHNELVVSADGHVLEPTDLFRTRLPKHLRERGVWEEDFEIEPLVEGGARIFRRLHTPGYEGWTISRYRQTGGRMPEGDPEIILDDMKLDGVDIQVMHPPKRSQTIPKLSASIRSWPWRMPIVPRPTRKKARMPKPTRISQRPRNWGTRTSPPGKK